MIVQLNLDDNLILQRTKAELRQKLIEGLIIQDYLEARLSLGEVAERLKMDYLKAREWLHQKGITAGFGNAGSKKSHTFLVAN